MKEQIRSLFVRLNEEFHKQGIIYSWHFPNAEATLADQEMNDIDHLWLGQPL